MAAQFKNVVTEIDTTGSGQLLLRCPAGKVILIKNIIVQNENASSSSFFLAFEDNSESTSSFPIQAGTINAGSLTALEVPLVLEEDDELLWQTSVSDQHINVHYVQLDNGTKQRYRMVCKSLTTADSANSFLTCPAGSTVIVNQVQFFNQSGGTASSNSFTITDSSTSTTKIIDKGSLANNGSAGFNRAFVLESGDSLNFTPDEQPMNVYASFLEIRNPPIRGQ
tara:strand:+ start:379 stop:1050 length:672 start_codon:yes stop_codon:yes gene_type:complete